jgi:hypothetical protein
MVREEERCTATAGGPDAVWLMSAFFSTLMSNEHCVQLMSGFIQGQTQAATGSVDHRGPSIREQKIASPRR